MSSPFWRLEASFVYAMRLSRRTEERRLFNVVTVDGQSERFPVLVRDPLKNCFLRLSTMTSERDA
jgi:hypothetical protein